MMIRLGIQVAKEFKDEFLIIMDRYNTGDFKWFDIDGVRLFKLMGTDGKPTGDYMAYLVTEAKQ